MNKLGGWLVASLGLVACSGSEATPQKQPTTSAPASASTTASAPQPSASADVVASAPTPTPAAFARVPVSATDTLARLPKDAAVVGWVRPASADRFLDWSSDPAAARDVLQKNLGYAGAAALLVDLGIEPGAPIAFAVGSPDRAAAEKLIDAAIKAKDWEAVRTATAKAPPNGTSLRLVARARPGADGLATLEKLEKPLRLHVMRCPEAKACAGLDGAKAVVFTDRWLGAVWADGDRVEIDLVRANDTIERKVELLATRRKAARGAPAGRCSALDLEADLAICLDGDRAGEIGAATGMLTTLSAVAGNAIDPTQRAAIVKQGKKESLRSLELAKPQRRLLDDGTFAVTLQATGFELRGSWAYTKSTQPAPSKPEGEHCATPKEVGTAILPDLIVRLGDRGADFKKPQERLEHVREAGWGGWLVLAARTWPNLLGLLEDGSYAIGRAPITKVCREVGGDRLALRVAGPAVPFLDSLLRPEAGPSGKAQVRSGN